MVHANVLRVEKSCELLRVALEAMVSVLENGDTNPALYELLKAHGSGICDENILAVRALVEWAKDRTS